MTDVSPRNAEDRRPLAQRPDFQLGDATIKPSLRTVEGPSGSAAAEPRVMQVLLVIADADGGVVSRDELIRRCWDNRIVGEDAVNRAIAEVRRAAREAGASFGVETIPRIGYRLVVTGAMGEQSEVGRSSEMPLLARRNILGGALAVAGAGGLGALWYTRHVRDDRQFEQLMRQGRQALLSSDPSANAWQYLEQAAAIRPNDAAAQGLLAYALSMRAERGGETDVTNILVDAERAASYALTLDPGEANARLALVQLQRSTLDFARTEARLRAILGSAPRNVLVMRNLWDMMQSVGRSRDALGLVERANMVEPLAAGNHYPRAQLLWILGRTAEADRVIDRALQYWPAHRYVRFARFTIYAFTGRAPAAEAMLDDSKTRPQAYTPKAVALWRVSLAALDQRSPASIKAARQANLDVARQTPALTNQAVMTLSALGEIDAAFDLANALLLARGDAAVQRNLGSSAPRPKSTAWRFAPWLFTPPLASLRIDERFKAVCDGIGLTEYWHEQRVRPDYQIGPA